MRDLIERLEARRERSERAIRGYAEILAETQAEYPHYQPLGEGHRRWFESDDRFLLRALDVAIAAERRRQAREQAISNPLGSQYWGAYTDAQNAEDAALAALAAHLAGETSGGNGPENAQNGA